MSSFKDRQNLLWEQSHAKTYERYQKICQQTLTYLNLFISGLFMNRSSYKRRLSSLRDKLVPDFPDTMWVIQPENRRYLSGFKAPDPQINETSGSLLISRKMALLI